MQKLLLVLFIFLNITFSANAADSNHTHLGEVQKLMNVKIEGVSVSTPLDSIAKTLENYGYNQVTSTTYIKRTPADNHRRSIHRIEIYDTDNQREISYIREKSGGRIKSPPKAEEPILDSEIKMVKEIYRIVCTGASPQKQTKRYCQPATKSNAIINNGSPLQIGNDFEVTLSASAANTTIRLKYTRN